MTRDMVIYGLILLAGAAVAVHLIGKREPSPVQDVPASEVKLITRFPQDNPVNMQALVRGRLWIVDRCVTIGDTAEKSRTTIWRAGFRVGKDERGMFVYHPDKKTRHRIGESVRFAGGYVESLEPAFAATLIEGGNLRGCPGPFVFVDSTDAQ